MTLLSKRALRFETSGVRALFDAAAALKDPVSFAIGQPDFGPTEEVKSAAIEAIKDGAGSYTPTQGIAQLREKISRKLNSENKLNVTPEDIIATPGTSAAFFLALSAILDPDDEVIIPDPYFVEYPAIVTFLDARPVFLDTYPDFQLNIDRLKKLLTQKTKAIIINTPNNPTGAVYPEGILRQLAELAREKNIVIISDEIYEKFIYDGLKHFSLGSIYENVITLGGLSKSGGIPGWRIAWASGPREIVSKMKDIQQYTFVQAPTPVQIAAVEAFKDSRDIAAVYMSKRDLACKLLGKKYDISKPQGAFYIMLPVNNGTDFSAWAVSHNVLVVPGKAFSGADTHVRISYATSEEKLIQGIEILLKY